MSSLSPAAPLLSFRHLLGQGLRHLPGLALIAVVAGAAVRLKTLLGIDALSPMMLGILLGCVIGTLCPLPAATAPGLQFAGKTLLRSAVALLGLQITLGQLAGPGLSGFAATAFLLFATFGFCLWIGRRIGVGPELSALIAAGTAVCGASAIAGVNGSLHAKEEEVTYAISTITLFGSLAMAAAPLLAPVFGLEPPAYGRWVGLSLHEVAHAVGAGFQGGEAAGQAAVIAKLSRVILLAPLILLLPALPGSPSGKDCKRLPGLPWFVLLFLILCGVNSARLLPQMLIEQAIAATPLLMTAALTALGLGTNLRKLGALGVKPLVLGAAGTLFISTLALCLLKLFP